MSSNRVEFDLFLDESGQFLEMSAPVDRCRKFPSQVVGLLAARGTLSAGDAEAVLSDCHRRAGLAFSDDFHATALGGQTFGALVAFAAQEVRDRGWRLVRLVNKEGVGYGDQEATYTHMVAELLLRIFERELVEHPDGVSFQLTCARYMAQEGTVQIPKEEYWQRLREYAAFAAVRRGLAADYPLLDLQGLELASGRRRRELQLCDLFSNASHDDFRRLTGETEEAFRRAFGEYTFTLSIQEFESRVDTQLEDGSYGLAIWTIAERYFARGPASENEDLRLQRALDRLAFVGSAERHLHLGVLTGWVTILVGIQRQLDLGPRVAGWLLQRVIDPLRTLLGAGDRWTLDGATYTLHQLRLTAANHRGDLAEARSECLRMDALLGDLGGQWENIPTIIEGLITQAVHLTDCFEHSESARRMALVDSYYGKLSELFVDTFPSLFHAPVRSEMRGKVLGTWLQAEMYAGVTDGERLQNARRLSSRAIEEFSATDEKSRQHQYRCQIETYAGDLPEARRWLAMSVGLADPSHKAIASAISSLGGSRKGFSLLHWLRIGAEACRAEHHEERLAFLEALQTSGLEERSAWGEGEDSVYPALGIQRLFAVVRASTGGLQGAESALHRLRRLQLEEGDRPLLALIEVAARLEVLTLACRGSVLPREGARLLDCEKVKRLGVLQLLTRVEGKCRASSGSERISREQLNTYVILAADPFSTMRTLLVQWTNAVKDTLRDPAAYPEQRLRLAGIARSIAY